MYHRSLVPHSFLADLPPDSYFAQIVRFVFRTGVEPTDNENTTWNAYGEF